MTVRVRIAVAAAVAAVVALAVVVAVMVSSGGEEWTYERALAEAVETGDPQVCERINRDHEIFDEHSGVIVPAEHATDDCLLAYAVEAADVGFCRSLPAADEGRTGPGMRGTCLGMLARELGRTDLCDEAAAVDDSRFAEDRHTNCLAAARDA